MARQGRTQRSSRSEVGRWSGVMFFFQAEDGIRCLTLTGVQTCALPIPLPPRPRRRRLQCHDVRLRVRQGERGPRVTNGFTRRGADFGGDALSGMAVAREPRLRQIGRAAWRERGEISGGARSLKKKKRSRPREGRLGWGGPFRTRLAYFRWKPLLRHNSFRITCFTLCYSCLSPS